MNDSYTDEIVRSLRTYFSSVLPERFFDILYQNNDIFTNNELNAEFLPGIQFNLLWKENISDSTRSTIWKYLQLLLFSTVTGIKDNSSFGDTAKLFEAIDENEFKKKLEDTIDQMQNMFQSAENSSNTEENGETNSKCGNFNSDDLPDPEKLHEHVNSMMEGKLGNLAKEIAEETANDMDIDLDDDTSVQDVFQKLLKNPTKLMDLVKNVGDKLDKKIKSGDIKESELLEEATKIMNKMKDTPGMGNFQNMFGNMGMPKGKMNTSAMKAHLERNMKMAKQKERMQKKYNERHTSTQNTNSQQQVNQEEIERANKAAMELLKSEGIVDGLEMFKYSTGETYEKSTKEDKKKNKKKRKKNK